MDFLRRRLSQGGDSDSESPSFSSSVSEGTSRFFSSLSAKKNGLLSDLSNKFESVGATLMKNSPSGSSENSEGEGQEKRSYAKQYKSDDSSELPTNNPSAPNGRVSKKLQKHASSDCSGNEENYPRAGVNMSFDEPLYSPSKIISSKEQSVGIGPSWKRQSPPPPIPPPPSKRNGRRSRTDSPKMSSSGHSSDSEQKSKTVEEKVSEEREKAPKFAATKRRSSTVDEMLFDDYVEPEPVPEPEPATEDDTDSVFTKRKTLLPMGDLISFDEPELEDFHPKQKVNRRNLKEKENKSGEKEYASVSSVGSSELEFQTSVDSSDMEFGGDNIRRVGSLGSEKSWSSTYSLDSQPDDLTLECMGFMKLFVEKIFNPSEEITQMEKAKFGEYCQQVPGRQWFARYVSSQRVNSKKVDEQIFFQLVQYFAVVLFECNESEDFTPAKNLMNMCFTFYHEVHHGKQRYKNFLYSYLREQPIWQSLRFWNAAFFDAVQNERARKPVCTSEDGHDSQSDDNMFQENISFGQLGTFTCNMRAFGLSKDLCVEFLRKQSIIANLKEEQVQMLKDNMKKEG